MPRLVIPVILASFLASCSGGTSAPDASPAADAAPAADAPASGDAATPTLTSFHRDAAGAICGALFRCCDGPDLETYFAPYRQSELLAAFADRLPPAAELDEAGCRQVVAEMFAVTPFGDWVQAAKAGAVRFDAAAFTSCVTDLDGASCGAAARAALYDSGCFGFAPPGGGAEQRRMFERTRGVGEACSPIRDGIGAAFFGTCDPHAAFCCYADPANPELGCSYPFQGDGEPRAGQCAAAAPPSEACSVTPPLQLCRTGSSCDSATLTCLEEAADALAVGDECVDAGFNLLGECVDSYCDILGTSRCEPLRADGAACTASYECGSGACNGGTCGEPTLCDGSTPEPPADAGPAADAGLDLDAGAPDALGTDASLATGESCEDALGLVATSEASNLSGYAHRVSGAFGAKNDYNPYKDASPVLPPACSIVYDAAGAEVVYRVELDPGDTLAFRYELSATDVPAAIYILDGCSPTVSWPDFDGSGSCGNNEYRAQSYCGFLGCDPIEWSFTYPTQLDGTPTQPKAFWLVLDHIGTTAPDGYQLDWSRTAAP